MFCLPRQINKIKSKSGFWGFFWGGEGFSNFNAVIWTGLILKSISGKGFFFCFIGSKRSDLGYSLGYMARLFLVYLR